MPERGRTQDYISNLSMDLIGHALEISQYEAFSVYQRNIERREPPFAHGEFAPCAIAVLLLTSGLDYHLARLKYLRDLHRHSPPLPHTPYFNWKIGDPLSSKVSKLLWKRTEKRLKEQLIELTLVRDSVAHPKLYLVRQKWRADDSVAEHRARISEGAEHRAKAVERKLKRSENTRFLRLPLVPTWFSYVDLVVCVLVLTRFMNLIENRYGNPYGWLGSFSVKNVPAGFFPDWGHASRKSISLSAWARGFFNSLAAGDQETVQKRLGADASRYIDQKPAMSRQIRHGSIARILKALQNPPPPEFLRKAPPWPNAGG